MSADRPLLGILLMLGFCVLAPLGDGVAKVLGQTMPISQLIVIRFAAQAIILLPIVWATGRVWRMRPPILALAFLRTLLHIAGIGFMFTALRYLPLADAVAIAFVMPFIMLLLGWLVLGEEVGPRRLAACAVGFAGTMMVVKPSFAEVGAPALLPLGVAVTFALFMLVTRRIAKEVDPISLQAVNGVMAVLLAAPFLWVTSRLDIPYLQLVTPSGREWLLLAAIGAIGTFAHLLMTWSLRFAPSATLAPMQYLEIPFATAIGWLMFHDLPDGLAALGIAVTVASGLYIVFRERAMSRAAPPAI
ncbi:EamA family transporter [Aquicoccus sp. SCR17]|nr:EamA family transporter [Carideicomes alvinocaridis]